MTEATATEQQYPVEAVLIVGCRGAFREQLRDAVVTTGYAAITACTPLETLAMLDDLRWRVVAVIIDLDLTQTTGLELLRYLAVEHPEIVRLAAAETRGPRSVSDRVEAVRWAHDVLFEPVDGEAVSPIVSATRAS